MQLSTYRRIVPLVAGLLLVVAACGGGSDSGSGGSGGTKSFTVGFTSAGMSSAPFLAALDQLRGQGYKIQTPELAESELSPRAWPRAASPSGRAPTTRS
jgi:hypothetical protein